MLENTKFLNDLITRLKKLSKDELMFVLTEVGSNSNPLDEVALDADLDRETEAVSK